MKNPPASVLVIESHLLAREALYAAISGEPDLMVAAQPVNCTQVLDMVIKDNHDHFIFAFKPDIIVLAMGTSGLVELETLKSLRLYLPETQILVLTSIETDGQEQNARDCGAHAVLSRSTPRNELIATLRRLHQEQLEE